MKVDPGKQTKNNGVNSVIGFPVTTAREIYILKGIQHENIIRLLDVITHPPRLGNGSGYIVSLIYEYMEHDLSGLWQNTRFHMDEGTIKHFMKEILLGLQHIHDTCGIIHRDVKSSNILINKNGHVKLADFGLAREFDPNCLQTNLV